MALGAGLLIGSVSFELIDEALTHGTVAEVGFMMLAGAAMFALGDWLLGKGGASERKSAAGPRPEAQAEAIVLGSVLDGIPESFVLGLTVLQGAVSIPLVVAIILSNLPEGMASSSGLRAAGWPKRRVYMMWALVVVVSGVAAAAGYALLDPEGGTAAARAQAFAGGALLAMVTTTMLPESYEQEGVLTGLLVVVGFAAAVALGEI